MKRIILAFVLIILTVPAYAKWDEPKQVLSGKFGKAIGEFGFVSADPFDGFPKEFLVDSNGVIIISDQMNKRVQIFQNEFVSLIVPKNLQISWEPDIWPSEKSIATHASHVYETSYDPVQVYSFQGDLLLTFSVGNNHFRSQDSQGNLYFAGDGKYQKYSPAGEILATYDQKPLELGIKTARRRAGTDNKYDTTVQFEGITYHLVLDGNWDQFVSDQNGYLYFYNSYSAKDPVSGEDSSTSFVVKYDRCGKKLGELNLPISEYEPPTQEDLDRPTTRLTVRNEYGPPVIGPDGSVYAWKRTPTTYSILKWTWVDSPEDPKGGPDAPTNLNVAPSTTGLYLSWIASPQDPGCVEGYEVERSSTSVGIFSNLTTTAPGVVKYNDTGAFAGSTYYYRIRAKSSCGPSPYTAENSGKRP